MATYSSLYYHLIWSTRDRQRYIDEKSEELLHKYIHGLAGNKKILLLQIGGMADHIHLLVRTNPDNNLPDLVKDIKVSTTLLLRQQSVELSKFSWQSGYGAFSISSSHTDAVKEYIKNQKEHHKACSFEDEWLRLLRKQNVAFDERYVFG